MTVNAYLSHYDAKHASMGLKGLIRSGVRLQLSDAQQKHTVKTASFTDFTVKPNFADLKSSR